MAQHSQRNGGAKNPFKDQKAFSLRGKCFSFHGFLHSKQRQLVDHITSLNGTIYNSNTSHEKDTERKDNDDTVYVVTDYWVDWLLEHKENALDGRHIVSVTEFWLDEVTRCQEWIDPRIHVFFTPPPRLPMIKKESLVYYPLNYEDFDDFRLDSIVDADGDINMNAESVPHSYRMRLPFSPRNVWRSSVPQWPYIVAYLHQPMQNVAELSVVLNRLTLNNDRKHLNCLEFFVNELLTHEEQMTFFDSLLPEMVHLVMDLPFLFPSPPLLLTPVFIGENDAQPALNPDNGAPILTKSTTLTKLEVLALVCSCFFCIFPSQDIQGIGGRSTPQQRGRSRRQDIEFPNFFITRIFSSAPNSSAIPLKAEKLRCIFQYFWRVVPLATEIRQTPNGAGQRLKEELITFTRVSLSLPPSRCNAEAISSQDALETLRPNSSHSFPLKGVTFESERLIEDLDDHIQIDFANKYAGGGVFNSGCVQEEIRFLLSPELFVSCLVFARLEPNEAFVIHGTERYCAYKGYAMTYAFDGNFEDHTQLDYAPGSDTLKRRRCVIVGIDAVNYGHIGVERQYARRDIWRDLVKAFVGFAYPESTSQSWPVASGNWGCGVFRGDAELKFLIQWLAASLANRDLAYVIFDRDFELHNKIDRLLQVAGGNMTTSWLMAFLFDVKQMLLEDTRSQRRPHRQGARFSILALATSAFEEHLEQERQQHSQREQATGKRALHQTSMQDFFQRKQGCER